jgi:hypothetical protein
MYVLFFIGSKNFNDLPNLENLKPEKLSNHLPPSLQPNPNKKQDIHEFFDKYKKEKQQYPEYASLPE